MKRIPKPFTVEFRRGARKGAVAQSKPVQNTVQNRVPASVSVAELRNPDRRNARILPALDSVSSGPPQVDDAQFNGPAHSADADVSVDELVDDPIATQPDDVASDVVLDVGAIPSEEGMADAVQQSAIRPRSRPRPGSLPREALRLGERWKHRLPQAVHSKIKRGQGKPKD